MIVLNRVLLFLPLSGSFNIVPTARLGRTELFGTNRKARRLEQKQQNRSRSKLLDELESTKKPKKKKKRNTDDADDAKEEKINDMAGMAKGNVIQAETTDRPEISTVVIDEDTGIEKIAQGKAGECSSHCKDEAGNCPFFSKNATKKPKCNYRSGILG